MIEEGRTDFDLSINTNKADPEENFKNLKHDKILSAWFHWIRINLLVSLSADTSCTPTNPQNLEVLRILK